MGRASGQTTSTTSPGARRGSFDVSAALASTLAQVNAIFPLSPDVDRHLGIVSAKAQRSVAGAQGRLFAALQDIYDAETLALSPAPADQQLAQTMTDNALWYVGRILGAFDKTDTPYLPHLRDALRRWGAQRGPAQLDYLQAHGLLPASVTPETVAGWRQNAGEHYVDAFSSGRSFFAKKGPRPVWNALAILERAGRAREQLLAAPKVTPGSYADRLRDNALRRADTLIKQAHTYLQDPDGADGTYDAITPFGPEGATGVEAVAHALTDPATRQLNASLEQTGVIERHRQLVKDGTGKDPDSSVLTVPDSRWLQQMSTYSGYGAEQPGDILALNVSKAGIFLTPDVARNMLHAAASNGFDEIAAHELVHTTQKAQPVGNPIADKPHANAYPGLKKRHQHFEAQLVEAATQAQTNHLRRRHDPTYDGQLTDVYPALTQLADEAQLACGVNADDFYRGLSAAATHQRTAHLAHALTGRDDERTQRDLYETLLTINLRAEQEAGEHGSWSDAILSRHRQLVRRVMQQANATRGG